MANTMNVSKETVRSLKNNDPLAHVYLLQDSYDGAIAEHRMYTEFVTDMGERLEDQPFFSTYTYTYDNQEITYDTGLQYKASLRDSYEAARRDVAMGSFSAYHAERQKAFFEQGEILHKWLLDASGSTHTLLLSLCPAHDELSFAEAKKQSFKPDRMMASIQLHTKGLDGEATTTAFSLDNVTLARLSRLLIRLGLPNNVGTSSLEQLTKLVPITSESTAEATAQVIIDTYDTMLAEEGAGNRLYQQGINTKKNIVEANAFVTKYPETYALYKNVIEQVAVSLSVGYVQSGLRDTVDTQLARHYSSDVLPNYLSMQVGADFTDENAAMLVNYLRQRAIPEYLMQRLHCPTTVIEYTAVDIGSAGVAATIFGRSYDGACPSSANTPVQISAEDQAGQLGLNVAVKYEVPRPILSKGDFDVLPIGSCPVCGSECGTGIKNKKSGQWYCTESGCRAFKKEVYNYVFNISELSSSKTIYQNKNTENPVQRKDDSVKPTVDHELQKNQDDIWLLKYTLYNGELDDEARNSLVNELIERHQRQQLLIRVALGDVALAIYV